MQDVLRDFIIGLNEEISYRESVVKHKKSLEASLWGLEEQIRLPENAGKEDQEEIIAQIKHCRGKVANCNQLIESHSQKVIKFVDEYKLSNALSK